MDGCGAVPRMRRQYGVRALRSRRSGRAAGFVAALAVLGAIGGSLATAPTASADLVGDPAGGSTLPCGGVTPVTYRDSGLRPGGKPWKGLVPVWAMVDGGLPVVGGHVTMYSGAGDRRRALLKSGLVKTNREGAVVVSPTRIPRSFTAVVRGGRVGGERFRGALRIKVDRYRSPAILTLNPVTTFGAAYRHAHPGVPARKAMQRVKRYLRIPAFHDVLIDLRRSDQYFDGETLLDHLKDRRLGELVGRNIERLDRLGAGAHKSFAASPATTDHSQLSDDDVPGFASFATSVIDGIGSGAGGQIGSVVMGAIINSIIGGANNSQFNAVEQQLSQIETQLTQLETGVADLSAQIASGQYSQLASDMYADLGAIDGAENCLAYLMTLKQDDPSVVPLSKGLINLIGQSILPIEDRFIVHMEGAGTAAGLIEAAYDKTYTRATDAMTANPNTPSLHFWTQDLSDQPREIFDYWAAYQAELALLVTEFRNASPGWTPAQAAAVAPAYAGDIADEQTKLKPRVPDQAIVQMNTDPVLTWYTGSSVPCSPATPGQATVVLQSGNQSQDLNFECTPFVSKATRDLFVGTPQTVGSFTADEYVPPFRLPDMQSLTFRAPAMSELVNDLIKGWDVSGTAPEEGCCDGYVPFHYLQSLGWSWPPGQVSPGSDPDDPDYLGNYFWGTADGECYYSRGDKMNLCTVLNLDYLMPGDGITVGLGEDAPGLYGVIWVAEPPVNGEPNTACTGPPEPCYWYEPTGS